MLYSTPNATRLLRAYSHGSFEHVSINSRYQNSSTPLSRSNRVQTLSRLCPDRVQALDLRSRLATNDLTRNRALRLLPKLDHHFTITSRARGATALASGKIIW